jgi:hypothetical protein
MCITKKSCGKGEAKSLSFCRSFLLPYIVGGCYTMGTEKAFVQVS